MGGEGKGNKKVIMSKKWIHNDGVGWREDPHQVTCATRAAWTRSSRTSP